MVRCRSRQRFSYRLQCECLWLIPCISYSKYNVMVFIVSWLVNLCLFLQLQLEIENRYVCKLPYWSNPEAKIIDLILCFSFSFGPKLVPLKDYFVCLRYRFGNNISVSNYFFHFYGVHTEKYEQRIYSMCVYMLKRYLSLLLVSRAMSRKPRPQKLVM